MQQDIHRKLKEGEGTIPRHFFLIIAKWQTNCVEEDKHLKAVECFSASAEEASWYPQFCSTQNSQSTATPIHWNHITLMNVLFSRFHKYSKPAARDISFLNSIHELKKQDWENINITSEFHPPQAIVQERLSLKGLVRLYLTTKETVHVPCLQMLSSYDEKGHQNPPPPLFVGVIQPLGYQPISTRKHKTLGVKRPREWAVIWEAEISPLPQTKSQYTGGFDLPCRSAVRITAQKHARCTWNTENPQDMTLKKTLKKRQVIIMRLSCFFKNVFNLYW